MSVRRVIVCAGGGDVAPWRAAFEALVPGVEVLDTPDGRGCDFAAVWAPSRAWLAALGPVRAVFSLGAGVGRLAPVLDALRGVPVVRIEDAGMADQMVECAMLAALSTQRRAHTYAAQQRSSRWEKHPVIARAAMPVAVLGLGALGGPVARALADFGYPVQGWSRRLRAIEGVRCFAGREGLREALSTAMVAVNLLPLTDATRALFDREVLGWMPRGATFVNLARGAHVVDDDLRALLEAGHLAHAVLDVFEREPLDAQSPWWTHPAVTITPHIAARSIPEACAAQMVEKFARLDAGLAVGGLVDPDAGY